MRALVVALALWASSPALAQSLADEAEVNFFLGFEAYDDGRLRDALTHFMLSNRLAPNKNVAMNIGHTYAAMKKYAEAYRWYNEGLRLGAEKSSVDDAKAQIAGEVGVIDVNSNVAGATVFVDRKDLGAVAKAPAQLALVPGKYKFIIEADGYEPFTTEEMSIKPGSANKASLNIDLVAITGSLVLTGENGATAVIQTATGELSCDVPCELSVPIGKHVLRFEKQGYREYSTIAEIREGEDTSITGSQGAISGTVRIDSNAQDAKVLLNGEVIGFTPTVVQVPVGLQELTLIADGFQDRAMPVYVEDSVIVDVGRVKLQPQRLVTLASRVEEEQFKAPSSVTVVPEEEFWAFGYSSALDALRGVRGVTVIEADLTSSVMIRGVGTASDRGAQTKTLLNGVGMSDQLAGQQYLFTRSPALAQLEVQRGSGSVLYGGGALTGVISMTDMGRQSKDFARAELQTYGNEGRVAGAAGVGDKELGAWFSVGAFRTEGSKAHFNEVVSETKLADGSAQLIERDINKFTPWNGMSIDARAWAGGAEVWAAVSTDNIQSTTGNEGALFEDERNLANNPTTLKQLTMGAKYTHELSENSEIIASANYRSRTTESQAVWWRAIGTGELVVDVDQTTEANWVGGDVQFNSTPSDSVRIVAGVEGYRSLELSLQQNNTIRPSNSPALTDIQDQQAIAAGYSVIDFQPTEWFKASAGIRLDSWYQYAIQPNPRLVAMFFPTSDDAIKLMTGRAFRAPVTFEQQYFVESISTPALNLAPESGWSYEAEYSHRIESWTMLASAWGGTYNDAIVSVYDPDIVLSQYQNSGSSSVYGVDAEVRRDFLAGWMVDAWVSYQVPTIKPVDGESFATPEQPNLLGAFKLAAPIMGPGLSAATRVVYEGARPRRAGSEGFEMPAGVIADFMLSGKSRDGVVGWRAGVRNVLDTNFHAATSNSTPSDAIPQTRGRTLHAAITVAAHSKKAQDETRKDGTK